MTPAAAVDAHDAVGGNAPAPRPIKVAIIGTGLAGCAAAHMLTTAASSRDFDVHLFESNATLGLDGSSVTHDGIRIDVPMRSVNAGYYPNLLRLYRRIGVRLQRSNFTFSFASLQAPRQPFLLYNGQNGMRGFSMPSTPAATIGQRIAHARACFLIVTSYVCLAVMALYHHACGHLLDPQHTLHRQSLQRWTQRHARVLHPAFVDGILMCLFSAVATSSYAAVGSIPAAQVLLYVAATFLRDHYTVKGGVTTVQRALTQHVGKGNVHLSCTVESVQSGDGATATLAVRQTLHDKEEQRTLEGFQHVILATPATLSAALVESYASSLPTTATSQDTIDRLHAMQQCLALIRYESSTVVTHTDLRLLPADRSQWRDLNLVAPSASALYDADEDKLAKSFATATHVIRRRDDVPLLLQTTNPTVWPRKDSIISSSSFMRATTPSDCAATTAGLFAWQRQARGRRDEMSAVQPDWLVRLFEALSGRRWRMSLGPLQLNQESSLPSVWVCGSYAQGIPLLEGCVTSSTLVVEEILARSRG